MSFLTANIDRAIVMTQFDLRGFVHPVFGRRKFMVSSKSLDATACNLMAFAAGIGQGSSSTDDSYVSSTKSSFEGYLAMCKLVAESCDWSQREAIQLIILELVRQSEVMKAEVASGDREESAYLQPLDKGNRWGKVVLALAEAFAEKLEQATV